MSAPHVLYVAWGFPPMAAGGTFRTLGTANALAAAGFDVTVLTAERNAFPTLTSVDPALETLIDSRIDVQRIPFTHTRFEVDVRNWPRERAEDPVGWLERAAERELEIFPEPSFGGWLTELLPAAERIHAQRPVDLVVGSANPHVVLAVGDHLHTRHGVPYVIDHRDAWRLNCYTGDEQGADDPRIAELETRYMANAHEVWFVNEPIRAWHQRLYPGTADRMRVVENGFDEIAAATGPVASPAPDRPLRFTYVGSVRPQVPVPELLDGWIQGREESAEIAAATASIYGPVAKKGASRGLLSAAARYDFHYRGPVGKGALEQVYADSDVLVLALGGGRFVTSGKVYEYVATGLPIVSVHDPESGAADVLRDYPLWVQAEDLSPRGIAAALAQVAHLARTAPPEQRRAAVELGRRQERSARLAGPARELFGRFQRTEEAPA
ncbi:glycosyl transferase [Pimelobacter simplex]|uniref:glycosyl transferase n=1 Tax=Nocardioides simplex TaxID=2045 RepID=UPI003AAA5E1D